MRTRSLQRLSLCLAALSVCELSACKTVSEEETTSGTLDPHSSASRARLDAAQKAFSDSTSGMGDTSDSDLSMKAFSLGSGDLSMGGYNTNNLEMKGFGGARSFGGAKPFAGADKSFGMKMSPLGGTTSEFSNQALAGEGRKTFFGKSYETKAYQPPGRGVRIPSFSQPKISSVDSLMDPSQGPGPEPVSVEDIRNMLNR